MTDKQLDAFDRELAAGYRPHMPFGDESPPVVFKIRTPIVAVLPALAVTLVLAALVWVVTG